MKPVVGKTVSLFQRDSSNHNIVTEQLNLDYQRLIETEAPLVTIKTDGTCSAVWNHQGRIFIGRRMDVKEGTENRTRILNGSLQTVAGKPCWVAMIVKEIRKRKVEIPIYIFCLDDQQKPLEEENGHMVGFVLIDPEDPGDKYVKSCFEGSNGDVADQVNLFVTNFTDGVEIPIVKVKGSDFLPENTLRTCELMGRKIADRYGYTDDRCFLNPHGSIVLSKPLEFTLSGLREAFNSDDPWCDVEGFVLHFSNQRFKVHRGHVGMERTWKEKKRSGFTFVWAV